MSPSLASQRFLKIVSLKGKSVSVQSNDYGHECSLVNANYLWAMINLLVKIFQLSSQYLSVFFHLRAISCQNAAPSGAHNGPWLEFDLGLIDTST
jgi:hypothetical protein